VGWLVSQPGKPASPAYYYRYMTTLVPLVVCTYTYGQQEYASVEWSKMAARRSIGSIAS
jgi:hypothetical protein